MAYIYKITNQINQKSYIGATTNSIQERWNQHCKDAFLKISEHRPLYSAMRKYGIENFTIEEIEECDDPFEREPYWIEYFNTYHDGYNATLGGEGRPWINREEILSLYKDGYNQKQISQITGHDETSIRKILKANGIDTRENKHILLGINKMVQQIKNNEIIAEYPSIGAAGEAMVKQGFCAGKPATASAKISYVCRGERKNAYGFQWRFS